jgi:hypothetical protein
MEGVDEHAGIRVADFAHYGRSFAEAGNFPPRHAFEIDAYAVPARALTKSGKIGDKTATIGVGAAATHTLRSKSRGVVEHRRQCSGVEVRPNYYEFQIINSYARIR